MSASHDTSSARRNQTGEATAPRPHVPDGRALAFAALLRAIDAGDFKALRAATRTLRGAGFSVVVLEVPPGGKGGRP